MGPTLPSAKSWASLNPTQAMDTQLRTPLSIGRKPTGLMPGFQRPHGLCRLQAQCQNQSSCHNHNKSSMLHVRKTDPLTMFGGLRSSLSGIDLEDGDVAEEDRAAGVVESKRA